MMWKKKNTRDLAEMDPEGKESGVCKGIDLKENYLEGEVGLKL